MTRVALFVPCYMDQLYPRMGIAALRLLEQLGLEVLVPDGAACCGQPPANAGFERQGALALRQLVDTFAECDRIVLPSGSCTLHVHTHAGSLGTAGGRVAARTVELCTFLHDEVGVEAVAGLRVAFAHRVALHLGCHGLRGLGLANPTELQRPPFNKVRALLETVQGISFAELRRPDECCGFGGTFAVTEAAVSAKMGRDRLRDFNVSGAEAVVSTDASCLMHLEGLAHRAGVPLPMLHVAEVLAGTATDALAEAPLARAGQA